MLRRINALNAATIEKLRPALQPSHRLTANALIIFLKFYHISYMQPILKKVTLKSNEINNF